MSSAMRILDANVNRAREALRVMEDAARFALDDLLLTAALKQLRHDFALALKQLDNLDSYRDAPNDVGTKITTETELARDSISQVVIAAGKRLSEALRSIEEYGKILNADFARAIEKLRYRGYDLEQQLNQMFGSGVSRQWQLCVILSENLCGDKIWRDVAKQICDAQPDCIQLREKNLSDEKLLTRAKTLISMASQQTTIIINDRPDIAQLSGAHGVHLGQGDLPCTEARRLLGRQLIIGVSTSTISEAEQALRDGADYCGVGPMFPTTTKHKDTIAGPEYLSQYLKWNKLPHLAIGGININNIDQLIEAGVKGIAVSAAICTSPQPQQVIDSLTSKISSSHPPPLLATTRQGSV